MKANEFGFPSEELEMPKYTPKTQEQLMAAAIAKLVSRTGLSDIGDSSVLKHLIAAMCRQDAQQYYQTSLLLQR